MAPIRKSEEVPATPFRRQDKIPIIVITKPTDGKIEKRTRRVRDPDAGTTTSLCVPKGNARNKRQPQSKNDKSAEAKRKLQQRNEDEEQQAMGTELALTQLANQKLQKINEGLKKKLKTSGEKLKAVESGFRKENEEMKEIIQVMRREYEALKKYVEDFCTWAQSDTNVKRLYKNQHVFPYTKVKVLMVRWELGDREHFRKGMLEDLGGVFADKYNYEVNYFSIPDEEPTAALSKWVSGFLDGSRETLLIFYYNGHGGVSPQDGDACSTWSGYGSIFILVVDFIADHACRENYTPKVDANPIQRLFEETESDALLLYQTCHSGTGRTSESATVRGVTEVISSCGFEGTSNANKENFTYALIEYLDSASKGSVPLSISEIYQAVLSKLRLRSCQYGKKYSGMFTTPVYCKLSLETKGDIIIHPLKEHTDCMDCDDMMGPLEYNPPEEVAINSESGFNHPEWHEWVSRAPLEVRDVFFPQLNSDTDGVSIPEESEWHHSAVDSMASDLATMDVNDGDIPEVEMASETANNLALTQPIKRKAEQDPDNDRRYHLRPRH